MSQMVYEGVQPKRSSLVVANRTHRRQGRVTSGSGGRGRVRGVLVVGGES